MQGYLDDLDENEEITSNDKMLAQKVLAPLFPLIMKIQFCDLSDALSVRVMENKLTNIIMTGQEIAKRAGEITDEQADELRDKIKEVVESFVEKNRPEAATDEDTFQVEDLDK